MHPVHACAHTYHAHTSTRAYKHQHAQTDSQPDRQAGRQTDRQIDRRTDRQTNTHTPTHTTHMNTQMQPDTRTRHSCMEIRQHSKIHTRIRHTHETHLEPSEFEALEMLLSMCSTSRDRVRATDNEGARV